VCFQAKKRFFHWGVLFFHWYLQQRVPLEIKHDRFKRLKIVNAVPQMPAPTPRHDTVFHAPAELAPE